MSFLHAFSIHFLVEITKCMLVVVSSFRRKEKNGFVKSNILRSKFREKRNEFETEDNNIDSLQKKLKLM